MPRLSYSVPPTSPTDPAVEPLFLTAKQVRVLLNVSTAKAGRLMRSGEFPVRYIGRNVRVFKADFDRWLTNLPTERPFNEDD